MSNSLKFNSHGRITSPFTFSFGAFSCSWLSIPLIGNINGLKCQNVQFINLFKLEMFTLFYFDAWIQCVTADKALIKCFNLQLIFLIFVSISMSNNFISSLISLSLKNFLRTNRYFYSFFWSFSSLQVHVYFFGTFVDFKCAHHHAFRSNRLLHTFFLHLFFVCLST